MKHTMLFIIVSLVCGCAPKSVPEPIPLPPTVPEAVTAKPAIVHPLTASVDLLTARQLPHAAKKSLEDANNYVAWDMAKAENIDKLTLLADVMRRSIVAMKANEVNGRYRASDVVIARGALRALRNFLVTKGD